MYKKFWIKTTTADDGKFTVDVGQGSEQTPLLSHTFDKEPNKINQIAFASRDKDKITIWGLADSKLHWPLFFRSKYKKYKYFPIPDVLGKYKMEMKKHWNTFLRSSLSRIPHILCNYVYYNYCDITNKLYFQDSMKNKYLCSM